MKRHLAFNPLGAALLALCAPGTSAVADERDPGPLKTVDRVDLRHYMGKWYEVARYPNSWQEGTVAVVAEYRLREDGRIDVIKHRSKGFGETESKRSSEAIAWVENEQTNAVWSVRFFWPFTAPYWIIDLGEEYEYAVVGQPSRKNLWILSRTPQLDEDTWRGIRVRLRGQGYDPEKLELTPHRPTSKE